MSLRIRSPHIESSARAVEAIASSEMARLTALASKGLSLDRSDLLKLERLQKIIDRVRSAAVKSSSPKPTETIDSARRGQVKDFDPLRVPLGLAAECLDQTRKTLENWRIRDGAPTNADGTVSLPALVNWRVGRAERSNRVSKKLMNWKEQGEKERAIDRRQRRLERRHKLIRVDRFIEELHAKFGGVRDNLQRLPIVSAAVVAGFVLEQLGDLIPANRRLATKELIAAQFRARLTQEIESNLAWLSKSIESLILDLQPEAQAKARPQPSRQPPHVQGNVATRPTKRPRAGSAKNSRLRSRRARTCRAPTGSKKT